MTKFLKNKRVFVAMSGGVDSTVAAALLLDADYDVEGITMCFGHKEATKGSACGKADAVNDARKCAKKLGIAHHVLDCARDLDELVIKQFTTEYQNGRTPNPCVRCNQYLKFGKLYQRVRELGADFLATGHYARLEYNGNTTAFNLKKARDDDKDQSYFLYNIDRQILPHILFPLGSLTKSEVRELAKGYDLPVADKPASQDICFIPSGKYKEFIRQYLGEDALTPGVFIDHDGHIIGEHQGLANYTIGQRDNLGLALGYRAYVYRIDKAANAVYVGPEELLWAKSLTAGNYNALVPMKADQPIEVAARIRYNAPDVPAYFTDLGSGNIQVDFIEPQKAVTPGQSVVLYQGDCVLGGAIIN